MKLSSITVVGAVILTPLLFASAPACASDDSSFEAQLSTEGSGVGRFRGGWYGAIGAARGSTRVEDATTGGARQGGFIFEGGAYGIFNPIRDYFDIEAGLGLKYVTPTSSDSNSGSATNYYYGYTAATVYAGPVFRSGNSGSAIALGVSLDLGCHIIGNSEDPFLQQYNMSMSNVAGGYLEYQYNNPGTKQIYFTRLTYSKYDLEFSSNTPAAIADQGAGQRAIQLTVGVKL
jgi:hypothetical protein